MEWLRRKLQGGQTKVHSSALQVCNAVRLVWMSKSIIDFNPNITGYNFEYVPTPLSAGGVGMYVDSDFKYEVLEKTSNEAFQALWVEIHFTNAANIICGVIYSPPRT